jgi:hypothetical protein
MLLLVAMLGATAHYLFGFSHADLSGHAWGSDDAYISFRYARNLLDGNGLVFNPGERVEGYTNFLYVLITSILLMLSPDHIHLGTYVFNLGLFTATLLVFHWYLRRNVGEKCALLGYSALCMCPIMWAWPSSGMETSAVLLVQLALFISAVTGANSASRWPLTIFSVCSVLSILLRADGFVFPFICGTIFLLKGQWRRFCSLVALICTISASVICVRYVYYGSVWPNTFYAKVSGPLYERIVSAARQMMLLFKNDGFFIYIFPLSLGWRPFLEQARKRRLDLSAIPLVPFVCMALLAYWVYVGGDVFYERFLIIIIPLSISHIVLQASHVLWSRRTLAVAMCFIAIQFVPFTRDHRFRYQLLKYDRWIELGKYLSSNHPEAILATCAAGKIPFYSQLRTIDMLGLNDAHIGRKAVSYFMVGHNKMDPEYVLSKEPDLIATWGSKELDLAYGITKDRYIPKGYTLKYMVNASPYTREQNIVEAMNLSNDKVAQLYDQGYTYFVIIKIQPRDAVTF